MHNGEDLRKDFLVQASDQPLGAFRPIVNIKRCPPNRSTLAAAVRIYSATVITGTHFLLYSQDAEADRVFFRDVLGLRHIDVGGGWLIFEMPPAEAGIHPLEGEFSLDHSGHRLLGGELYLMCDDLKSQIAALRKKNVECSEAVEADWGMKTTIPMPSGGEIGLYQPRHATAFNLKSKPLKSKSSSKKTRSSKQRSPKKRSPKKQKR